MKSVKEITGTVFNIQRFSIQDGPGIRTTVFLKGCPLTCLWCSNPESQHPFPEVAHRDSLCIHCGECLKACSHGAIHLIAHDESSKVKIDRVKCINCGACVQTCKGGALKLYGQVMSVEEAFAEVRRDTAFYANSGGGVTASGGEPLSQAEFVAELFHCCRRTGIHTTIETCGYGSVPDLEKILSETDLVLFDLKLMDGNDHRKFTKKLNRVILRNARLIVAKGIPMIIRIPLIPGVNDSEDKLNSLARFVSELNYERRVNLLPYHRLGEGKYKMLDRPYELALVQPPEDEHMREGMELFKRYNLDCTIEG
jgi:pyruvate formate lyase activating enzyme